MLSKISLPMFRNALVVSVIILFGSCATGKYIPDKKLSQSQLKEDYLFLKNALELKHPSLYWYTTKDSMDEYFNHFFNQIKDSMCERDFAWNVVSPLLHNIRCGHTSVSMSKMYVHYYRNKKLPAFPLYFKIWNDTAVVFANLNKDSTLMRGTIVKSINNIPLTSITDSILLRLPIDGYGENFNLIRAGASFPYFHRNIFGIDSVYKVKFINSSGDEEEKTIPVYRPAIKDTGKIKVPKTPVQKINKNLFYRSLAIDSNNIAVMEVNSFTSGNMRRFFRRSFRELRKKDIKYLILDIRNNSGGKVGLSTMLTKYIIDKKFRVSDTTFAKAQSLKPFTRHFKGGFFNNLQLYFSTHRGADGKFHMGYLERHFFKPKKRNHFNGKSYILIGGPTFSAASVFAGAVKGSTNVILAGEETGGGWHGNNGIMIPALTLPNSKLRINFPLFRIVQFNHVPKNGMGVMPDILIETDYKAIKNGKDKKMRVIKEMILEDMKTKL